MGCIYALVILLVHAVFSSNVPTKAPIYCPNGENLSARQIIQNEAVGEFDVFVHIKCAENLIIFELVYLSWNNNWFGLVFNDRMFGDALIYTVGKEGENRNPAMYLYNMTGKNADDIIYKDEWTRIGRETWNGINIGYEQDLSKTQWDVSTKSIRFKYAIGYDMVLKHHQFHSNMTYTLNLVPTAAPTLSPSVKPTTEPSADPTMEPIVNAIIIPPGDVSHMFTVTMIVISSVVGLFCCVGIVFCYRRITNGQGINHERLNDGIEFKKWNM